MATSRRTDIADLMRGMYREEYSDIQMPELETFVVPDGPIPADDPPVGQLFRTDAGRAHMTEAVRAQLAQNFQAETRRRMEEVMSRGARYAREGQEMRGLRPGVVVVDEAVEWNESYLNKRGSPFKKGSDVVTCFGDYKGMIGKVEKVEWSKDQNDFLVTIKFDESYSETVKSEYVFRK